VKPIKKISKFFRKRYARLMNTRHFSAYLANEKLPRLHIGCGVRTFKGWLNTDLFADPKRKVIYQDLSKKFPCQDQSFQYIFSEHVHEHFSFKEGKNVLFECFRALKEGGVLRLATPDVDFYINLYLNRNNLDPDQKGFLRYFLDTFEDARGYPDHAVSALNGIFYGFGHRFISSFDCLEKELHETGFRRVMRVQAGQSEHEHLRNLETQPGYRDTASGHNGLHFHLMANLSIEAVK